MRTRYWYGPPVGRRMMRRARVRQMMHEGAWCEPGEWHHHHRGEDRISAEDELVLLEEYQRDLEEALADVADRVKALKRKIEDDATPNEG